MYKVFCVIAGVALFVPLWVLAQVRPSSASERLSIMRDRFRPLLIFYSQDLDERGTQSSLKSQKALLHGHDAELKNRDVKVLFISSKEDESVAQGSRTHLRKQFHIDDGRFTVVLLGKDGGEKFRSHVPVTIEKLDMLIDAMPMRQQEVRDGLSPE